MNQSIKVILVTAAGFALGYGLYSMLTTKGVIVEKKAKNNGNGSILSNPEQNADAIGDAVAGILID